MKVTWALLLIAFLDAGVPCEIAIIDTPHVSLVVGSTGQPKETHLGVELKAPCHIGRVVVSYRESPTSPFRQVDAKRDGFVYRATLPYSPNMSYYLTVHPERGQPVELNANGDPFPLDTSHAAVETEANGHSALGLAGSTVLSVIAAVLGSGVVGGSTGVASAPIPTPSPIPAAGTWVGQILINALDGGPISCVADLRLMLGGSNEAVTGAAVFPNQGGCPRDPDSSTAFATAGRVTNGQVTLSITSPGGVLQLTGSLEQANMMGMLTGTVPFLPGQQATGTWHVSRQ